MLLTAVMQSSGDRSAEQSEAPSIPSADFGFIFKRTAAGLWSVEACDGKYGGTFRELKAARRFAAGHSTAVSPGNAADRLWRPFTRQRDAE